MLEYELGQINIPFICFIILVWGVIANVSDFFLLPVFLIITIDLFI